MTDPTQASGADGRRLLWCGAVVILGLVAACQSVVPPTGSPASLPSPSIPAASASGERSAQPASSPTASASAALASAPAEPFTGWQSLPAVADLGPLQLTDVVTTRFGMFAIGQTADGNPNGSGHPVIIRSDDGQSWTTAAKPAALGRGNPVLRAIAAGDAGIAVLGALHPASEGPARAILWLSPDGTSWRQVTLPAVDPRGAVFDAQSLSYRSGRWVIVGVAADPAARRVIRPLIYWSTDASHWRQARISGSADVDLASVGSSEIGFVADGHIGGSGAIWTSPDGEAWQVRQRVGDSVPIGRIRPFGPGTFVVSYAPDGGTAGPGPILESVDDRTWKPASIPGLGNGIFDVIELGSTTIAVGRSDAGDQPMAVARSDGSASAWQSLPEEPLFEGTLVVGMAVTPGHSAIVGVGTSANGSGILELPIPGGAAASG